jgi:hypothetical protein
VAGKADADQFNDFNTGGIFGNHTRRPRRGWVRGLVIWPPAPLFQISVAISV